MPQNYFLEKDNMPDSSKFAEAAGASFELWHEIKNTLIEDYGTLTEEWKYYGKNYGWTMKLFYKKRNLLFLTVVKDHFTVAFVYGEKAGTVILNSDLPEKLKTEFRDAKKFMEGRGLKVAVKNKRDMINVIKLARIKISF